MFFKSFAKYVQKFEQLRLILYRGIMIQPEPEVVGEGGGDEWLLIGESKLYLPGFLPILYFQRIKLFKFWQIWKRGDTYFLICIYRLITYIRVAPPSPFGERPGTLMVFGAVCIWFQVWG